jgi:hypothetical protein
MTPVLEQFAVPFRALLDQRPGVGPSRANAGSSWALASTLTESIWMRPIWSTRRRRWRRSTRPLGRASANPCAASAMRRAAGAETRGSSDGTLGTLLDVDDAAQRTQPRVAGHQLVASVTFDRARKCASASPAQDRGHHCDSTRLDDRDVLDEAHSAGGGRRPGECPGSQPKTALVARLIDGTPRMSESKRGTTARTWPGNRSPISPR